MTTNNSDPGKKVAHEALVNLLQSYVHELQAIDAISNTDERRSKCSSTVVRIFESLSVYLDDKEIGPILVEITNLTQHCMFFFRQSTPVQQAEREEPKDEEPE